MSAAPKAGMSRVLAALGRPKVAVMLALGFSSGLPFMLIGNTLTLWLNEAGVSLAVVGFSSWIGLTYSVKFLWGALVDRLPPPVFAALGRRRGWMILTQLGVAAGLAGMAAVDPRLHLAVVVAFALAAAVFAASQDTVVDAWRIEVAADGEELGLLTSAYSLGYRLALIATESLILLLAQVRGWNLAYGAFAALMSVGVIAALAAREPARGDLILAARQTRSLKQTALALWDAVAGPFSAFFRAHGVAAAALILTTISLYHLCDYMRGPMSNPYYRTLGISKVTIAEVRATVGLAAAFTGIALGGVSTLRLGVRRSVILGALVQPAAVAAFAALAWHGGDFDLLAVGPVRLTAFEAVMAFDGVAMSYSGVALVAYMSTLTSLGYTATQYALLTSALTWTGKTLKGFSGVIVEHLQTGRTLIEAYGLFYLLAAAIGLPAILITLVALARDPARPDPSGRRPARS